MSKLILDSPSTGSARGSQDAVLLHELGSHDIIIRCPSFDDYHRERPKVACPTAIGMLKRVPYLPPCLHPLIRHRPVIHGEWFEFLRCHGRVPYRWYGISLDCLVSL